MIRFPSAFCVPSGACLSLTLLASLGCGDSSGDGDGSGGSSTGQSPSSTTAGSGGASGSTTSTGSGQGGAPAGLVPMFVMQGHVGRTAVSCDDGQSFVFDQSDDAAIRCFENGFDCDHHPGAANGIAYADGAFYATYGWGTPGSVRRTADGSSWTRVLEGTSFGDIAAETGRVVGASRVPQLSTDDGQNWSMGTELPINIWNVREGAFIPHDGGRYVFVGNDGNERIIAVSDDGAQNFTLATVPANCDISFYRSGGIAYGNGVLAITNGGRNVCLSDDGGQTFTVGDLGQEIESNLLFTGTEFMAWGGGNVIRSSDGQVWTSSPLSPAGLNVGPVAVSPEGIFVGVRGGWNSWYDNQRAYRSQDGVSWQELGAQAFSGGHPIVDIAFGYGQPSALCPAP